MPAFFINAENFAICSLRVGLQEGL
jgi:hypothetical protein